MVFDQAAPVLCFVAQATCDLSILSTTLHGQHTYMYLWAED